MPPSSCYGIGLGFFLSRSPGVSFWKVKVGLAARTISAPNPFHSQEHGGSCQKRVAEPVEKGGTTFQAQMRWEGPFLTVICGYLLRGPYVPMPAAGQMEFTARNMHLLLLCSCSSLMRGGGRSKSSLLLAEKTSRTVAPGLSMQGTPQAGAELLHQPGGAAGGHALHSA